MIICCYVNYHLCFCNEMCIHKNESLILPFSASLASQSLPQSASVIRGWGFLVDVRIRSVHVIGSYP